MNIAVVGAGYAGLGVTWHLLQRGCCVSVFDGGVGASHVSTGLLHSAPGKWGKPTWRAEEGMKAAKELLEVAGGGCFVPSGILRFAPKKEWIAEGITVFSKKYLQGLKKACAQARFEAHFVKSLSELDSFDQIVLTVGADTLSWVDLPLSKTIGQCLVCKVKEPLPYTLLGTGHISVTEDPSVCLVGSTYEHTEKPDPQKVLALLPQLAAIYPAARDFEVLEILSGVRISPKVGIRPVVQKVGKNVWVFTGLGSRGLIYHSLLAKSLSDEILLTDL